MSSECVQINSSIKAVVVTGASGLIGRHLVPFLADRGVATVAIDQAATPAFNHPLVATMSGNLHEESTMNKAFDCVSEYDGKQKALVHLAGASSFDATRQDAMAVINDNVLLTAKLLQSAHAHAVNRFLFASSGLVYGGPSRVPFTETSPTAPGNLYGATKLAAESLIRGFASEFKMSCEIIRLSNVYSPDSPGNTVIGKIIGQIKERQEISLQALRPVRDFIYVADVCEAICRLLGVTDEPGCFVTNVSTGVGNSIGEVARISAAIAGRIPFRASDPANEDVVVLNNGSLKIRTGWSPGYSMSDGLSACLTPANRLKGGLK